MRFIGNKERLVDWIYSVMQKHDIEAELFFDFFAGTSSVGKFFKQKGYQVVSSDLLYFSYVLQKAYICNNEMPKFEKLLANIKPKSNFLFTDNYNLILEHLNQLDLADDGFVYQNYAPTKTSYLEQPRMYFTDENAKKIDTIRLTIEEWKNSFLINDDEYYLLLATLIESVGFFSNILGVYGAFKKVWDKRALKPFYLKPISIIQSQTEHFVFNKSSLELLNDFKYDIIYLDPPYNHRQYAPNYHILETIARYDNPAIKGVSGMRDYQKQKSTFCNKLSALRDLETICKSRNYKYLLLSYNDEGVMPQEEIVKIMSRYGSLRVEEYDYLRFKSNSRAKSKKFIKEQIYILKNGA